MRRLALFIVAVSHGIFCGLLAISATSLAEELSGKDLFVRKWTMHDERSLGGDGLGPMHNATSCVECHHQGGPGGAGGREHNVDLLSVVPPSGKASARVRRNFEAKVLKLHSGFDAGHGSARSHILVHRFGPDVYSAFRAKLLDVEEEWHDAQLHFDCPPLDKRAKRRAKPRSSMERLSHNGVILLRIQRNTPALWGSGLIDSIPDAVLQEIAASQAKEFREISGRLPRATGGGVGRFGWRGQTETLRQFVLAACANELGLQSPGHPQQPNPLAPRYKGKGDDLTSADIEALVKFVLNLPRPQSEPARNTNEATALGQGERIFTRIGCSACHMPDVGRVEGLFSDLLLHDMGPALEDPVKPNPETRRMEQMVSFGYSGSGSIFVEEEIDTPELAREWRTPPLWGVADSAPYLHDGRAQTLIEAINLHGGEAATAAQRFRDLSGEERSSLIFFLESLVAPR